MTTTTPTIPLGSIPHPVLEFECVAIMAFRSSVRQALNDQIWATRRLLKRVSALHDNGTPGLRAAIRRLEHQICNLRARLRTVDAASFEAWRVVHTQGNVARWGRISEAIMAELADYSASMEAALESGAPEAMALAAEVIAQRVSISRAA